MVSRPACYHRRMENQEKQEKQWDKDWTQEEEERARQFAQSVVDRSLALPTTLFLESVRPLHFIGGQFLHFMAPISGLVVNRWDLDALGNFLEHRGAVPFVIDEIQRLEKQRDAEKRQRRRDKRDKDKKDKAAGADPQRKTR